jgi:MFS superfamily sulfate permease-like transporter
VVLGVELGITISLAISVLWIIKKTSLPHLAILGKLPNTNKFKDISQFTRAKPVEACHSHIVRGKTREAG